MNEIDNEIDNIFFKIDVFKKEVYFFSVSSPSDKKLIHTYSFDSVLQMADDYFIGNYEGKLQSLYDLMIAKIQQLDIKEKPFYIVKNFDEEYKDIEDLEKQLEAEFDGNIFAKISLSVLSRKFIKQRDYLVLLEVLVDDEFLVKCLVERNVFDSIIFVSVMMAKRELEKVYTEIINSMNRLSEYVGNDFRNTSEIIFKSDGGYILETEKRYQTILYSVNESVEPFIQIILANVCIANLKVYTCKNCGSKYFGNTDKVYCPKTICQQEEEKETRKKIRHRRKSNPYTSLLDSFSTYIRQQKHKLTQKNLRADDIERFDTEKNNCLQKVRAEIESYKNSGKPIDDELLDYINTQKQYIKNLYDNLLSVNKM